MSSGPKTCSPEVQSKVDVSVASDDSVFGNSITISYKFVTKLMCIDAEDRKLLIERLLNGSLKLFSVYGSRYGPPCQYLGGASFREVFRAKDLDGDGYVRLLKKIHHIYKTLIVNLPKKNTTIYLTCLRK